MNDPASPTKAWTLAISAMLGFIAAEVAQAQTDDQLAVIVVTARKREENLQRVPEAVTAIGSEQLRTLQVESSADLQRVVSNTTMTDQNSILAGTLTAFIRGIGTDPGFQQGVGVYIDDMYLQSPFGTDVEVYSNIERIEVLKGPQGNLYGRNTTGGAIKYVTRDPGDEADVSAEVRAGRFDLRRVTANASGPLIANRLYGGIGALWKERDGYQSNLTTGQTLGSLRQRAVHGLMKLTPSEDLSIRLGGTHSLDQSDPRAPTFLGTIPAAAPFQQLPQIVLIYDLLSANVPLPQLEQLQAIIRPLSAANSPALRSPPVLPVLGPDSSVANLDYSQYRTEASSGFLTAQWSLTDEWSLKSSSTYRLARIRNTIDLDGLADSYVDTFQHARNEDVSQEFQMNYATDRLAAVGGLYYLHGRDGIPSDSFITPRVQLSQSSTTFQSKSVQNVESSALYGNVDYNFTDRAHLSLGARYTREDIGIELNQSVVNESLPLLAIIGQPLAFPLLNTPLAIGTAQGIAAASGGTLAFVPGGVVTDVTSVKPSTRYTSFTPSAKIAFDLSSAMMVYAGFAEGYKAGGFDTFRPFTRFEPEKVKAYTLGFKSTGLEGRVRFNAEAFYNDYTDKQLSSIQLIGNSLGKITRNAGSVTTSGADFDAAWLTPLSGLTLGMTAGYLHTKVEHFFQAGPTGATIDSASVTRLGFSPKWTGAGTATYTMPFAAGSVTLATSVAYRSQSYTDSPIDITNAAAALESQGAHAITNASATFRTADERWQLILEGRNLSDKRVLTNTFNAGVGAVIGQYNDPRLWSVSAGYRFQ